MADAEVSILLSFQQLHIFENFGLKDIKSAQRLKVYKNMNLLSFFLVFVILKRTLHYTPLIPFPRQFFAL